LRRFLKQEINSRVSKDPHTTEERLAAAIDAAHAAGAILKAGVGGTHHIQTKSADTDLLTEIDLQAEDAVLRTLRARFVEDRFLAEESGEGPGSLGTWIIDPLDGTTNYAHAIPLFSVSIAYADASGVRLGVVYDPMREELFQAVQGGGSQLNGHALAVSDTPDLNQSLLTTGFPYDVRTSQENNLDHYADLALRTQGVRRFGSAALDLAYVAAGRFDGYWEVRSFPWDVAAGVLLVTEAGGKVSQVSGAELPPFAGPEAVSVTATNGRIHDELLAALTRRGGPSD
jgi:myo-inositol-1(or 4)-monophosphatase